ncbi:hypothetical protein ACPA9J_19015 [Pseudomonas aeruginosa]
MPAKRCCRLIDKPGRTLHRVPRLERTAGGRPRGTPASAAQAASARPASTCSNSRRPTRVPDPPGRGALLVQAMMSNHHILIDARVPWLADERDFFGSTVSGEKPPGEPADAAALPRLHRLAATPGPGAIATLVEREPARLRAADPVPSDRPFLREHAGESGGMIVGDRYMRLDAADGARLRELAQRYQLTATPSPRPPGR